MLDTSDQLIVKRAARAYSAGQYNTALRLYQQAAQRFGAALFEVNIKLCEQQRETKGASDDPAVNTRLYELEDQLNQTQQLLEYYFNRNQELEYQLLDQQ